MIAILHCLHFIGDLNEEEEQDVDHGDNQLILGIVQHLEGRRRTS
jgi:hypothetical protein